MPTWMLLPMPWSAICGVATMRLPNSGRRTSIQVAAAGYGELQRSSVSCASSDVSRDMLTLFQPKRTIPTLRFPSAKESQLAKSSKGSKGSKGNPKASLPTTQREPLQITGKKDYKTLLEEQMKLDQELQASAGRYQEMMEQFELSQRNAHRMLDMYLCTDPWAPTNNNAAFPQDDTTAA
eukprot:GGOE01046140.1.p2 GENE.GGOE01046140.1~~GGOE01046140.1.p2  ORF type:complete len:180 (-),score=40.18 GGOE01046140.1:423-962(-)